MMLFFRAVLLPVFCLFVFVGCWEEETRIHFDQDGSGEIEQTLVLSERLMVASSQEDGSEWSIPYDEASLREVLGESIEEFELLALHDLPDGSRKIHWRGTFSSTERFLTNELAQQLLQLRVRRESDTQVFLSWYPLDSGSFDPEEFTIERQYGLLQGLYLVMELSFPPGAIVDEEKRDSILWEYDLRNREGLERSRALVEAYGARRSVLLNATALGIDPEVLSEELAQSERREFADEIIEADGEISVQPVAVSWKKVRTLSDQARSDPELTVEFRMEWSGPKPEAHYDPVATRARDDTGRNLVAKTDFERPPFARWSRSIMDPYHTFDLVLPAPSEDARSIHGLEGYIPVVVGYVTSKVTLENAQDYLEQEETGIEALDEIDFTLTSIGPREFRIQSTGSVDTFHEIYVIDSRGNRIENTGHSARGGDRMDMTFRFPQELPENPTIEIHLLEREQIQEVRFGADTLELP